MNEHVEYYWRRNRTIGHHKGHGRMDRSQRCNKWLALESLKIHIGDGEAASIILYREINADLLAINDLKARGVASAMGVHIIGTLGYYG